MEEEEGGFSFADAMGGGEEEEGGFSFADAMGGGGGEEEEGGFSMADAMGADDEEGGFSMSDAMGGGEDGEFNFAGAMGGEDDDDGLGGGGDFGGEPEPAAAPLDSVDLLASMMAGANMDEAMRNDEPEKEKEPEKPKKKPTKKKKKKDPKALMKAMKEAQNAQDAAPSGGDNAAAHGASAAAPDGGIELTSQVRPDSLPSESARRSYDRPPRCSGCRTAGAVRDETTEQCSENASLTHTWIALRAQIAGYLGQKWARGSERARDGPRAGTNLLTDSEFSLALPRRVSHVLQLQSLWMIPTAAVS